MTANASREPSTAVLSDIAPDSGRKLTSTEKWRFGVGFVLFSLIWMVAGTSGSAVLLPQRFTELNIGMPEVILGTMNSVGCVFALFSNVIFGALSDITRSRFGKRTPWIVAGGLITAAGYVLAFSSAQLVGIVAGWCIVQVGVNMMIAPAVAVLSDRIPENVRGTFSAFYGGAQIVGSSAGTFLGSKFIENMGTGFAIGAALFAVTGIVTVLIWPRERSSAASVASVESSDATAKLDVKQLLRSFIPPTLPRFLLGIDGQIAAYLGLEHDFRLSAVYSAEILRVERKGFRGDDFHHVGDFHGCADRHVHGVGSAVGPSAAPQGHRGDRFGDYRDWCGHSVFHAECFGHDAVCRHRRCWLWHLHCRRSGVERRCVAKSGRSW